MSLSFLPDHIKNALDRLNINFVTEIRLKRGQPVILGYRGEYYYLGSAGLTEKRENSLIVGDVATIVSAATGGSVYNYAEQIKSGFITCEHGVRIGLAGEYITQNGEINTVTGFTSLNIRIPHDIKGCADELCGQLLKDRLCGFLLFSKPGLGKTTLLRDTARYISDKKKANVLLFDERNEIAAMDASGNGYELGDRVDVVRSGNKLCAFSSAIRAMKPDVIITDELYGDDDIRAVKYAADCGITVIASSHVCDKSILKAMPFEFFVEIPELFGQPVIYDKNFNPYCRSGTDGIDRRISLGK